MDSLIKEYTPFLFPVFFVLLWLVSLIPSFPLGHKRIGGP